MSQDSAAIADASGWGDVPTRPPELYYESSSDESSGDEDDERDEAFSMSGAPATMSAFRNRKERADPNAPRQTVIYEKIGSGQPKALFFEHIPRRKRSRVARGVIFVLLGLLILLHVSYYFFTFHIFRDDNLVKDNIVVVAFYWADVWLCTSAVLSSLRPVLTLLEILGGPITLLVRMSPPARTLTLAIVTSLVFYILSIVFIETNGTFVVLFEISVLLIIAATFSAVMMSTNTVLVVRSRRDLMTPTAVFVGNFMVPLAHACRFRLFCMELVIGSNRQELIPEVV
jgi:hypothetical protein